MLKHRSSRLIKICTGTNSGAGEELLQLEGALEKLVHFWVLVVRHFIKNRCLVRASALAFTTLLALIPLLVVAVGVTSSLLKSEGENQIYQAIDKAVSAIVPPANVVVTNGQFMAVPGQRGLAVTNAATPAVTNDLINTNPGAVTTSTNVVILTVSTNLPPDPQIMTAERETARNIHDYIQNAQSGKLGITGMVLFILTAIGMLRGVENTFNDIWGVTEERQWWHQLSSYFTIVALGPVVIIAAATLAGGPSLHWADHLLSRIPVLGRMLLEIGPLAFLWLVFALFYMLVPNTQVKFSAALFGGFIAGTLWHLNKCFFCVSIFLAGGHQQRDLRQARPGAGVHGGPLFFVGDFAVWRAGGLRLSKPRRVSPGSHRRKRQPARARVCGAAHHDPDRPAFSERPAAGSRH